MKKGTVVALVVGAVVVSGLFLASGASARWGGHGYGMGAVQETDTASVKKFQKATLNLRDELTVKEIELRNEYAKQTPDRKRITTIRKEIVDLETKIEAAADKYGITGHGFMGGRGGHGMMGGGMMGSRGSYCYRR